MACNTLPYKIAALREAHLGPDLGVGPDHVDDVGERPAKAGPAREGEERRALPHSHNVRGCGASAPAKPTGGDEPER